MLLDSCPVVYPSKVSCNKIATKYYDHAQPHLMLWFSISRPTMRQTSLLDKHALLQSLPLPLIHQLGLLQLRLIGIEKVKQGLIAQTLPCLFSGQLLLQ